MKSGFSISIDDRLDRSREDTRDDIDCRVVNVFLAISILSNKIVTLPMFY